MTPIYREVREEEWLGDPPLGGWKNYVREHGQPLRAMEVVMAIRTVEQARALREVKSMFTTDDGQQRSLSPEPLDGDSIALFTDDDGRTMRVVHTVEDGWCKTEHRL